MVNIFGFKITFYGNPAAGTADGFCDKMSRWSDSEIKEADLARNMLNECLPPSRWFSEGGYSKALKHIKQKDFSAAVKALDIDTAGAKRDICVWVFQNAIVKIIKGCPKLLSDALPQKFY